MYSTPHPQISQTSFRSGAIAPLDCIRQGWELLRDHYWLFFAVVLVGVLVAGAVPFGLFLGPMMCGIHLCFHERMRGRPVEFTALFKGVDHFVQSLIATLFQIVPAVIVIVPLYIYMLVEITSLERIQRSGGRAPSFADMSGVFISLGLMFVCVILLSAVVSLFYIFVYPLICDRKLSGVEAVKLSFQAALGNIGGLLGLLALNILLSIAGLMLCGFGMYLVLPLSFASYAVAYRQVFPDLGAVAAYPPPPPPHPDAPNYGRHNQYPPYQ
jgi:hypothetical protein